MQPAYGGPPAPPFPPPPPPARRVPPAVLAVVVAAVLAVMAAAAFAVYAIADRRNAPYERNLREARALGAPAGFARRAERNAGGGTARVTFARTCAGRPCDRSDIRDAALAVTGWLRTRQGIQAVIAMPAQDGESCAIGVRTSPGRPPITRAGVALTPARSIELALDVG
ncbi:hypothetical protein [Actinomadura parmotrematis]|uniref:Flp pilus-assembly TadG-like N-terminal domain-containing protein n=1 Tax=Actinomadura parmotrematis TaxID=2864039 RepID=A0ABS7FV41_9ACTN|nr:hypothetical protein [Actinomadura parmotrematis]MBW8484289.1 hypothetical protein [Actinomadura parmotrematis]